MNACTIAMRIGWTIAGAGLLFLSGCLSPIAMHRAVIEYDRTVSRVEAELLLLNIARARHHRPVHFTAVSSVAATFDFRTSAGVTGRIARGPFAEDPVVDLTYGVQVAENPTVTIIPISGEEFTERILRSLEESHFDFLAHQGFDINMILQLMARGMTLEQERDSKQVLSNTPGRRAEFIAFRQALLHLASLQQAHTLFIEPMTYEEQFPVAIDRALTPAEAVAALDKGYRWTTQSKSQAESLTRKVIGRLAITNYEPWTLTNEERRQLNDVIQRYPLDHVFLDIRPGFPGGEWPMRGVIQLRSFNAIISFVARSIAEDPGFHVDPDPRSGPVTMNPDRVLEVEETAAAPRDYEFSVEFEGQHYAIRKYPVTGGMLPSWNQECFSVLANLFQMTVTDVSNAKTPIISISKGG
ncbi:MAG: hypothetical protein ICV75_06785 [Nitrospiraceae bacterium]|nr:hypothetical protein [Nitrospiraceae bacterium]